VLITCNIALPQLLWLRKFRVSPIPLFIMSLIVNSGMWFERFVIIVVSLSRDFLPSSWGTYKATRWDYMTFGGTLGLFTALFFLFIRLLPMIPMHELRSMLPQAKVRQTPEPLEAGD
jgi:molybdopterin-containing oxidoreductase family membrane subunit